MGYPISHNQTLEKINICFLSKSQLEMIMRIIPVQFNDSCIAVSHVLGLCYAICVIYGFHVKTRGKKIDYNALLVKTFGHIICSSKCDFKNNNLQKQVDALVGALIYRVVPVEVQMPEGLISFYYCDGYYCTAVKWKLSIWTYMHSASARHQLRDNCDIFRCFNDIVTVSSMLDVADGDTGCLQTLSIRNRFMTFMNRTGTFNLCYSMLEDLSDESRSYELNTFDFILGGLRGMCLSIGSQLKNIKKSRTVNKKLVRKLTTVMRSFKRILNEGSSAAEFILQNLNNLQLTNGRMKITINGVSPYLIPDQVPSYVMPMIVKWIASPNDLRELIAYTVSISKSEPSQAFKEIYSKRLDEMLCSFFSGWVKQFRMNNSYVPILCDWDGSLNSNNQMRQILVTLSKLSGMKVPILTDNADTSAIFQILGADKHYFEIFSIGKVLLDEMNVYPFLITAITTQVKAWMLSMLHDQKIVLFDNSSDVWDACDSMGCAGNVIKTDGDMASMLVKIGGLFLDSVENTESNIDYIAEPPYELVVRNMKQQLEKVVLKGSPSSDKSFVIQLLARLMQVWCNNSLYQPKFYNVVRIFIKRKDCF
jgi:hypothetical protein